MTSPFLKSEIYAKKCMSSYIILNILNFTAEFLWGFTLYTYICLVWNMMIKIFYNKGWTWKMSKNNLRNRQNSLNSWFSFTFSLLVTTVSLTTLQNIALNNIFSSILTSINIQDSLANLLPWDDVFSQLKIEIFWTQRFNNTQLFVVCQDVCYKDLFLPLFFIIFYSNVNEKGEKINKTTPKATFFFVFVFFFFGA